MLTASPFADFYTRMFIQDASLGVMPVRGRTRRPQFQVLLTPPDPRAEQMILSSLSGHRGESYYESLEGALSEFFRVTAAQVCAVDRATYLIGYCEEAESKMITGFDLVLIDPTQNPQKSPSIGKRKTRPNGIVSPDEVIVFEPPLSFRQPLRMMRDDLSRLGHLKMSTFVLEAMDKKIPYDFKAHDHSMKLALAKAVRGIGWTARGTFSDSVLSYYWIQMNILFHKFKIELRETMLDALNAGLLRVGQKIGFTAQLAIVGLPEIRDADEALDKLNSGHLAFTEIMKVFDQL